MFVDGKVDGKVDVEKQQKKEKEIAADQTPASLFGAVWNCVGLQSLTEWNKVEILKMKESRTN